MDGEMEVKECEVRADSIVTIDRIIIDVSFYTIQCLCISLY